MWRRKIAYWNPFNELFFWQRKFEHELKEQPCFLFYLLSFYFLVIYITKTLQHLSNFFFLALYFSGHYVYFLAVCNNIPLFIYLFDFFRYFIYTFSYSLMILQINNELFSEWTVAGMFKGLHIFAQFNKQHDYIFEFIFFLFFFVFMNVYFLGCKKGLLKKRKSAQSVI